MYTQKQKTIAKRHVFLTEKYVEDVRQDEKHVPDLLESIMRPTDLAKEELRPNLFKMMQIMSKIQKFKVSTFWIPEFRSFLPEANAGLLAGRFPTTFGPARAKYIKKTQILNKNNYFFAFFGCLDQVDCKAPGGVPVMFLCTGTPAQSRGKV